MNECDMDDMNLNANKRERKGSLSARRREIIVEGEFCKYSKGNIKVLCIFMAIVSRFFIFLWHFNVITIYIPVD